MSLSGIVEGELDFLEAHVTKEIEDILATYEADHPESALTEIQPPSMVRYHAAAAAAQVLLAFERGYRMSIAEEDLPADGKDEPPGG